MANYKYPKDMNLDIQPYFMFNSFSWSMRGKKTQEPTSVREIQDSIVLPMATNGVIEAFSHNWDEASSIGSESYTQAVVKNLIGKVVDLTGDLGKYMSVRRGFTINDYASLAFSGSNFRIFDFSFQLAAKNASESSTIQDIIKAFKRNSLPSYQGWKILYPNFWSVSIVFPNNRNIIKIKDCVITNLNVSHFPDNVFNLFKDGNPIKPELTVTFKELDKIDRSEYQ